MRWGREALVGGRGGRRQEARGREGDRGRQTDRRLRGEGDGGRETEGHTHTDTGWETGS